MFTKQIAAAMDQLVAAGMPREQADILQSLLGDCAQFLQHNGPVELAKPDPRPNGPEGDENYYPTYALNIPAGSSINNWGDDVHHGNVYNVDNTVTNNNTTVNNTNVTENHTDSTINYGGNTTITFGPNVTLTFQGDSNCRDVVTEVTPTTTSLDYIESVTLQSTVVTSVSLQETVVTDVDINTSTCELTVTKMPQSYLDGSQSYQPGSVDYVSDVDATTDSIAVLGDCEEGP